MKTEKDIQDKRIEAKSGQLMNIRNVSVGGGYALVLAGLIAMVVVATMSDHNASAEVMAIGVVCIAFGEMVETRIKKMLS